MINHDHIERNKRQRFEEMAVRLANYMKWSEADTFMSLPLVIQTQLNGMKYIDVVLPLIRRDREENGLSYRGLEIKYGVSKSTIQENLSGEKK